MSFEKKITFVLVFLIAFAVSAHSYIGHSFCKKARLFRKHRQYFYSYSGVVENGIKGSSENSARMRISANVVFDYRSTCEYSMTLNGVKVEESFGVKDSFRLTPTSRTTSIALQRFPLRFVIHSGEIMEVRPVLRERQKDILNIKRGILSAFQVKWSKMRTVTETDVSGVCSVRYYVKKHKTGTKHVKKVKDLLSCKKRALAHSNIETNQYKQVSSIYDASSSCEYSMKKKNEIEKAVCNEYYLVKPFSTPYGAGSYTNISQVISLQKVQRIRHRTKTNSEEFYRTSLLYEHNHEEKLKSSDVSKAVALLHKLVQSRKTSPLIASDFAELIYAFRAINEQGIGKLLSMLGQCFDSAKCSETDLLSYRSFFFDALSQCGTGPCVNVIANLIISKKIPQQHISNVLIALNFIQIPSPQMINAVLGIYKATQNPASLLLLGTLMHKLCKHRPHGCREKGTIKDVISNAEYFLMHLLGNDCRNTEKDRNEVIYHTLKAIGNAGRPVQMKSVIIDCLKYASDSKISIAAVHALRRMHLGNDVTSALRTTLIDRNMDPEKRMESFLLLMKNPSEADIILSNDMVNDRDEAHQIRSFINSFLSAAVKNKDPSNKRLSDLFRRTLANAYRKNFDPSASRFSKVYGNSFFNGYVDVGAGYSGYTIFHPESFLPRTVKLAIHTQILGHSVDVLEVNARMEGLEIHANNVLGEKGYFSKDFMKKIFAIPKNIESGAKSRQKRSVRDSSIWAYINELHKLVNMKESVPDMDLSIKVFGNEIKLLKLKDIPFLNGDLDDLNILQTLYSLTKGKSTTFQRNVLFLEGSYTVPTVIGLPLAFEINGSAAVSLNLDGKIKMKNLIFGPKMVTLQGSAVPSATMDISGKVTVYGISSKAGLKFHSKTHASSEVSGEVDYEEGKELKVKVNAPDSVIDLFSYSHELFHVVGANELPISGSKKRTKLDICTNEFTNFSKLIGLDVCADFNFPVAYHDLEAPFYPLSGPASIGFRLQKTDAHLKMYFVHIVQKNGIIEIDFGTPGALNSRKGNLKLGITPWGQRGTVGATFGSSNQGISLNYEYDNNTNGLKTNVRWNFTGKEVKISANFYNETDPATLDLQMGCELNVRSTYVNGKSKLNFIDTYGYWGIDWFIDFGSKPFHSELKVAYNPQTVFTRFSYGEKNFAIQLVPAYPLISYDMQVNWRPAVMNFTLKADLIERKISIVSNTSMDSYSGSVHWEKTNGLHKLIVTTARNQDLLKWLTRLDDRKNRKLFISRLNFRGKTYGLRAEIRDSLMDIRTIGFPATVRATLSKTAHMNSISMFWNITENRGHLMLYLHNTDRMGKRKMCGFVRSGKMYHSACVSATKQDSTRKALKFELTTMGKKASVDIMHTLFNSTDSPMAKDAYVLQAKLNDVTSLFTKLEIDQDAKFYSERISSFVLQLPKYEFDFNMKFPAFDFFTRKENTSGWMKLKYNLGQTRHSLNLEAEKSCPSIEVSQINLAMKFKRSSLNCTDMFSYIANSKVNEVTKSTVADRESLTITCGKVHSFQEHLMVAQGEGKVKWEAKYRSTKVHPVLSDDDLVPTVKKNLELVKPVTALYAEYIMQPRAYNPVPYSVEFRVDVFDNHVHYNMDFVERIARLGLKLPKFESNIQLNYSKPGRYDILAGYSVIHGSKQVIVNQTGITVMKVEEDGLWEVRIHHPHLKTLIRRLMSMYELEYRKYQTAFLNISNELISKMKLSNSAKKKILGLLKGGGALLLENATNAYDSFENKWRMLIKEIINEQVESALSQLKLSEISNSTLRNRIKSLIPRAGDVTEHALTFDRLKIMFETNRRWQTAKKSLIQIARSRDFRRMVIRSTRRALFSGGLSLETRRVLLRMVNTAINNLDLKHELPILMLSYIKHTVNKTHFEADSQSSSFLEATLRSLNLTRAEVVRTLSTAKGVFRAIFNEIDRKTNLDGKVKKILQMPLGNRNSSILTELGSLNKFVLGISSDFRRVSGPLEKGKGFIRRKLLSVSELIPGRWRLRVDPITKKFIAAIAAVKSEKIASNATEVLFNIGEILFNSVFDYIATNFSSDLEKDLKHLIHILPSKAYMGNFTLSQYWERVMGALRERFMFGLRLTAQVFPRRVEYFRKEYLKDGKISLEKLYQDFAHKDFVSPKNVAMVKKMFITVGEKIFLEMSQATGNFSTGRTLLNMLNFAKDADFKNFDSVMRSYEKMKTVKHQDWSLAVLMHNLKDALKDFGSMKIGNQTFNELVIPIISDFNSALPKLIERGTILEKMVKRAFKNGTESVIRICNLCRGIITKYSSMFDENSAKWQKLVKFASELTIPSLSMTQNMLKKILKRENFAFGNKSELYEIVESFLKNDPFNLTSYAINLIESTDDQPPEKMLKTMLMTLAGDVQHVQMFTTRKIKVIENLVLKHQKELRDILAQVNRFLARRSKLPLHKFIQKSIRLIMNYLKSSYANSSILNDLQLDFGSMYNFTAFQKQIDSGLKRAAERMENAFRSFEVKKLQVMANARLPNFFQGLASQLAKGVVNVLRQIDASKDALLSREYLVDPKNYLRNLPKRIVIKIRQRLLQEKHNIFRWFSNVEALIKRHVMERKIIATLYMEKIQNYISNFDEDLKKLDYFAAIYKLAERISEEHALSNYTLRFRHELKMLQKLFENVMKSEGRSLLPTRVQNMLDRVAGEEQNAKTLSSFINRLTSVVERRVGKIRQTVDKKDMKTQAIRQQLYQTLKTMQKRVKLLQNDVAKFVKMKITDESTVVLLVPDIDNFQSKLTRFFSWNGNTNASMDLPVESTRDDDYLAQDDNYPAQDEVRFGRRDGTFSSVDTSVRSSLQVKRTKQSFVQYPAGSSMNENPMRRESLGRKTYSYSTSSGMQGGSSLIVNETFTSSSSVQEFASQRVVVKSVLESLFIAARKSFDFFYGLPSRSAAKYQGFFAKLLSESDSLARSLYTREIMVPLKRISEVATIPIPAEKLQSILKRQYTWKRAAARIFTPIPATATFFNGNVITFDGKYLYLPSVAKACPYLLSRDFRHGMFTFLFTSGQLHMYVGKMSIVLSRNGNIELASQRGRENSNLPTEIEGTLVRTTGKLIEIISPFGLRITCNSRLFHCDFVVPGMFHNKTLGIFGSNNAEFADDFKLPNGLITFDLISFINSWKISGRRECHALSRMDFPPFCSPPSAQRCYDLFYIKNSPFSKAFMSINPSPYFLVCQHEILSCSLDQKSINTKYCPVVSLYVKRALEYGIKLEMPAECESCRLDSKSPRILKFNSQPRHIEIVLIVRDSIHSKRALANLKHALQKVDNLLNRLKVGVRYTLVGFGGIAYRFDPYIQTGLSRVSGDISNLLAAMDNLQYAGTVKVQSGLNALKFASQLDLRPTSSKIFIVLDSVAVYSGSLRQMIEANNMLTSKGIILNVINNYRFKKGVIGQDSFNVRYHLKIPKGERLRNIPFHTSDDYVPIVKESGGALMTVRGLVSKNEKWIKAFPISLREIILNQIKNDGIACKSCSCVKDVLGFGQLQCANSIENAC